MLYFLCVWVFRLHVCLCTTCVPGNGEVRRGCWIPWSWSYRWLRVGIKSRAFGSAACALNCWAPNVYYSLIKMSNNQSIPSLGRQHLFFTYGFFSLWDYWLGQEWMSHAFNPTLRGLRQDDCLEFEARTGYGMNSTMWDLLSKQAWLNL